TLQIADVTLELFKIEIMTIIIVIVIIAILVLAWIGIYNGLVKARMQTQESWSQIDVQLKRRNDLIPNLVETVKGYAKHESENINQSDTVTSRCGSSKHAS
ncbi:hypothetical protein Pfo_031318, partial [Paulownia fortunei]